MQNPNSYFSLLIVETKLPRARWNKPLIPDTKLSENIR